MSLKQCSPADSNYQLKSKMKWLLKAFIQRAISLLPASERINYVFQKNISKNLPVNDITLDEKIDLASKRVDIFLKFGDGIPLSDVHFMEFGAGWDMLGPLSMYALGVGNQTLLDITSHLRFELINNALDRLRNRTDRFQKITGRKPLLLLQGDIRSKKDLLDKFSIDYHAPLDASKTGFSESSVDFISTNSTLEHISAPELPAIMKESFRILKPGGIICHFVDMKDHYSYFDGSISKYNFLKFSNSGWKFFNSPLQYQNRLRLPEYIALIKNAGFKIIYEEIENASENELADLKILNIHSDYKRFSEMELSAQIYRVVARKPFL
jgi:SAM-dependent methyltransferase